MTTRLKGLTVAFSQDIREDDVEAIVNAIRMIKGVMDVLPIENTSEDWIIKERVKRELSSKIYEVLK